jgi:hypothetical protein
MLKRTIRDRQLCFRIAYFVEKPVQLSIIFQDAVMGGVTVTPLRGYLQPLEVIMIQKQAIISDRIRKINGTFAWIGPKFLRQGFWNPLTHHEFLLYLFLVLVGDRCGLSYYSFDKICTLLSVSTDDYIDARNALIDKDLIAFDGHLFPVLSLPEKIISRSRSPIRNPKKKVQQGLESISQILMRKFAPSPGEIGHE